MNIIIIGTTAYQDKMQEHKAKLEKSGHNVSLPAFDNFKDMSEFEVCDYNRKKIEWADEVHIIWDARSIGTVFDLGMCFALYKPIKLIYINTKTFPNFVNQYAEICL